MRLIRRIIFQWRKYLAIKTAIKAHEADGRKYLVIVLEGKPTVVSKSELRKLKARGALKKGITVKDIEKRALFISK